MIALILPGLVFGSLILMFVALCLLAAYYGEG